MEKPDVLTLARAVYRDFQDNHLAAGPLADMARWVETGRPPRLAELRARGLDGSPSEALWHARKAFVRSWGFAVPCLEAVAALQRLGPVVEIGAGSGYWSEMLRNAGHDAIATDAGTGETKHGTVVGSKGHVERLEASGAVLAYPERDVFCSWPSEAEGWCAEALKQVRPGRQIALVLDDRPAMTGDESLRRFLAGCDPLGAVELPRFPGVMDRLWIYRVRPA